MAVIDREPRSASAVAESDCGLVTIDKRRFWFLVQETPYFAEIVMRVMASDPEHERSVDVAPAVLGEWSIGIGTTSCLGSAKLKVGAVAGPLETRPLCSSTGLTLWASRKSKREKERR